MKYNYKGCKMLTSLKNLTVLSMWRTNVGNNGVSHLSQLKNLKKLNIGFTSVTRAGISWVSKSNHLTLLETWGMPNDDNEELLW